MKERKIKKLFSKLQKYLTKKDDLETKIEEIQDILEKEKIRPKSFVGKFICVTNNVWGETVFQFVKEEKYTNKSFNTIEFRGPGFSFFKNYPQRGFKLDYNNFLYIYSANNKQKIEICTKEDYMKAYENIIKIFKIDDFLCQNAL